MIRGIFLPALLVLVTLSTADRPACAAAAENDVRAFVSSMADTAIKSLTGPDIERNVRKERFRTMIHDYFAVRSIAKWVLGRHWRRATEEQRGEYLSLFEAMLLERYVDGFKDYTGESLDIVRAEKRAENDFIVHTLLRKPGGTQPIDVAWRVATGGRDGQTVYKIIDIFLNGISMAQTQQKEFNSLIHNNGNSVEALLEKMREIAKPAG
ncbi:MAG: ABC transporter substrate-binding protein [Rhodospirillaceae bacterium]